MRSFYRLDMVGKKRFQCWKLLIWAQFQCPRLIPDAIILAIYGYHFRRICEMHVK